MTGLADIMQETKYYPEQRSDLVFREIEGEFVVYSPSSDCSALLNPTAAMVLELCDGSLKPNEIAAKISESFSMAEAEVLPDVEAALRTLSENEFLKTDDAGISSDR